MFHLLFCSKGKKSLTDVYQSMALHMFLMLNSLTVCVIRSVPSNTFRENVTWKPSCDFRLFLKDFRIVSLGMQFFYLTLNTALHIPSPLVQYMYHRHVSFIASAMLTVLRTKSPNPVRSLCYRTRLHTLGSVFSHITIPLDADCRRCHAVQTSVYVLMLGATGCIVLPCSHS